MTLEEAIRIFLEFARDHPYLAWSAFMGYAVHRIYRNFVQHQAQRTLNKSVKTLLEELKTDIRQLLRRVDRLVESAKA